MPPFTQQSLDEWFPTFIRYLGAFFLSMLIVAQVFFGVTDYPGAYAAAGGMILYKTFDRARRALAKEAAAEEPDDFNERWSGLP